MKETPTLFSKRLRLRAFGIEDAEDVYEWCSSINVTRYLFWYPHRDKEVSKRLLSKWIKKKRHYSWCIEYEGKAIGEIEIIKEIDASTCEIGYTLNEAYWRKGIMKEGLQEVLSYLFFFAHYNGVSAFTDIRNLASNALLSSLGFNRMKKEPYYIAKKDEYIEIYHYYCSKEDFEKRLSENP